MRIFSVKSVSLLLLLVLMTSCTPESETVSSVESASEETAELSEKEEPAVDEKVPTVNSEDKKTTPEPVFPVLEPGDYCYTSETENETLYVRLDIEPSDRVTGDLQGTVHNEAAGYYTSYRQSLDGTIDGSNLNLDVATWIEYDRQNSQEVWRVSKRELTVKDTALSQEDCAVVNKVFQNEDGLEASDLTDGANTVRTKEVFFESGKRSTTVSDVVVRGDRDVYLLSAQGGQQMTLSISSVENSADFDVVSPSGVILGTNLTEEKVFLPDTGEYQVIVGGTRDNTTYDLEIGIE